MSWRSIPPELGVPTVLAALVDLVGMAVSADQGLAFSLTTGLTRTLLIAYGLLVLRRRAAGRASPLLALGAALKGIAASVALVTALCFLGAERGEWVAISGTLSYAQSAATVGFAIAMIGAARAWRSPLAPIAIVTSLAWHMPRALGALVDAQLHGRAPFGLLAALAMLAAQVALLGLYARVADPAAPADPIGAERGARRVALVLAVRALLVAASGVVLCVQVAAGWSAWMLVLGVVIGLAALGCVVGEISGLLAMATARLASLSSVGLYIAGFAALWHVLLETSAAAFQGSVTELQAELGLVVGTAGMAVACWAVRGVAGLRRDRALRSAIANRVAWIIAIQVVNALATGLAYGYRAQAAGLFLLSLALQISAMFLLSGLLARVADRIQVNAAADVF